MNGRENHVKRDRNGSTCAIKLAPGRDKGEREKIEEGRKNAVKRSSTILQYRCRSKGNWMGPK